MVYMKKLIKRGKKKRKGFTLIELLAVILILGIIALIAVPTVNGVVEESRQDSKEESGNNLVTKTSEFCVSLKVNKDEPNSNVLSYESEEYPTVESLIGIKGDVPNYENFIQYELTDECEVKVIYKSDGYICSNQLDSDGNVTYTASLSNTSTDKVTCKKNDDISSNTGDKTNGINENVDTNYVLKSYYGDSVLNEDFRSDTYRSTITEIEFTYDTSIPASVSDDMKWDVSEAQDGTILAWIVSNKLYIGSNKTIYANQICTDLFSDMTNLTKIIFGNFNTSNVINMDGMFEDDSKLTSLDLSIFDTSNVIKMNGMFSNDTSLTSLNVSSFNTSNVTNMSYMFNNTGLKDLNVGSFDTSNVTVMAYMFSNDASLTSLDLTNFNTSNVSIMYGMFSKCYSLSSITGLNQFDTSNVTDMRYIFNFDSKLTSLDLSGWDMSKVSRTGSMFANCSNLETIYVSSNWNISNVKNSNLMFNGCTNLKGAVAFDETKVDGSMANYETGYLTLKK